MNIDLKRFKNLPEDSSEFLEILEGGFDAADEEKVEAAANLAFLHFVIDETDHTLEITNEVSSIPYDGNYDRWTWVEYCQALQGFLTDEVEEFQALTDATLKAGTEDQVFAKGRVYQRFLEGQSLGKDDIEDAMEDSEPDDEFIARMELLMEAVRLHSLGGGKVGIAKLKEIIREQKEAFVDRFEFNL